MKKLIILVMFLAFGLNSALSAPLYANNARGMFINNAARIYVLNMRTFSADDDNGNEIIEIEKGETPGTFLGAIKKLDGLKDHNINMVHLLPITPVGKLKALGTAGSLYAMDDFNKLNPQLDDKTNPMSVYDEAKLFIQECHKRGIAVIVDLPSCGSYDMFLRRPELFMGGKDGKPVVPSDWTDVRLFKSLEKDNALNDELLDAHKSFIDLVKKLGADGVRADVATIKPYEFWQVLINYARRDDKQFLFLAEASPIWTDAPAKEAPFTTYDKLTSAGFDGYLGNFMNYRKFEKTEDLFSAYEDAIKLGERSGEGKSIVLNFATHDDVSPMLVSPFYARQILWLSATLPGNMYFVNGFITGDYFIYSYANKKADVTYTDDPAYYTHKGKLDIFNFSRSPGSADKNLSLEFKTAAAFKTKMQALINSRPEILRTGNKDIFAYQYSRGDIKVIVILNHNTSSSAEGSVAIQDVKDFREIMPVRMCDGTTEFKKGKLFVKLNPSDIMVMVTGFNNLSSQNK